MALRLQKLRSGHGWRQKLQIALAPRMFGFQVPDVLRAPFYRPNFFGKHHSALTQSSLRGPSFWTVAERELFAGWVSSRNQCAF